MGNQGLHRTKQKRKQSILGRPGATEVFGETHETVLQCDQMVSFPTFCVVSGVQMSPNFMHVGVSFLCRFGNFHVVLVSFSKSTLN